MLSQAEQNSLFEKAIINKHILNRWWFLKTDYEFKTLVILPYSFNFSYSANVLLLQWDWLVGGVFRYQWTLPPAKSGVSIIHFLSCWALSI